MASDLPNATLQPGFFDGRLLVEIDHWDWPIYVGPSPSAVPVEHRFQGALNFSRAIEIVGRIRAPKAQRDKLARIWISPFGPEVTAEDLSQVGRFYRGRADERGSDFQMTLRLPEAALTGALTCLSSVWRHLDVWIANEEGEQAGVTAFSFSATLHPNLSEWAGPELGRRFGAASLIGH